MDPDELREARAEMALYFDQVATVSRDSASTVSPFAGQTVVDSRGVRVSDQGGGFNDAQAQQTTYPCRVASKLRPPETIEVGAGPTSVTRFVVSMPYDADVRFRDVLVIGGNQYRVEGVNAGESNALTCTAECERVS
ncbi:MAG: hypothetical protein LC772_06560 [Chloroflexi bacterium]|nr:hypothetical protein [Chloroflexota bacterium]